MFMDMERRALYNLLRMNWLRNPTIAVQAWQVADYREMTADSLFDELGKNNLPLDRVSYQALADEFDTPEELTDHLIADLDIDATGQDKIYLLIFELWRRYIPEKLCLSVFCDELDYQIDLYDREMVTDPEELQDVLAHLAVILDENTDRGEDPREVFESIGGRCANDLETFLYDFIAEQIDNKNELYAGELIDDYYEYIRDVKWFDFLKIRLISSTDMAKANILIRKLLLDKVKPDPEFNLEVLAFLVQGGDRDLFSNLLKQTLPVITVEEEFQELLSTSADYLHRLDYEKEEMAVQEILKKRIDIPLDKPHNPKAPQVAELLKIIK